MTEGGSRSCDVTVLDINEATYLNWFSFIRDVNKDLTPKDQDKDLTPNDKDLKYVLKESLRTRTRTRTTARQIIIIAHINLSNVQL